MSEINQFKDIEPKQAKHVPTATQIATGIPVPPVRLIEVLSPDDWEAFTEEWLSYYKNNNMYDSIRRYSGPGDLGLDVVAFTKPTGFKEPWDSFQCKHYDSALTPEDVCAEVGKIIYHSFNRTPPFNQTHPVPRKHTFVAPKGVGITVGRWLKDADLFKKEICNRWDKQCTAKLGKDITAPMKGEFKKYIQSFNYSIFTDKTCVELVDEHSKTIFHIPRFGGGLPPRGAAPDPPDVPSDNESLYLRKLLDVYEEEIKDKILSVDDINAHPELIEHWKRQRILFYNAEALRNFARDRTPDGTFDSLLEDILNGIIDICESEHKTSMGRLRAAIIAAANINTSGNALNGVTRVADKQGACHQLANKDQITWVPNK